jgi:hypothetical protein
LFIAKGLVVVYLSIPAVEDSIPIKANDSGLHKSSI